ncbi:hypothetical protein Cgig2_032315 [Carnegiea gigantea]|uniref:Uncharacterized protein n=1 Tax=Carnegiea gigantea TaxID=171969 RepID=A0A9Q1GZL6_9CARY|nr:hypothetical protein Cgig2_032315 [Carnegiea gigantea]
MVQFELQLENVSGSCRGCGCEDGRRGEQRRLVQHARDEHTLVIKAWFARQLGVMVMLLEEGPNKDGRQVKTWGEIIELSDDNEFSMMLDDDGDEETTTKGVMKAIQEVDSRIGEGKMAGPSRRRSHSRTSRGSGATLSYFNNDTKYYCNCSLEDVMVEMDDNYRCRYIICPRVVNIH